jgi:hypothetical protein
MFLINFQMDNRFAVRLGTCSTCLRVNKWLRGIVPWLAIVVRNPSTTVIFLLLGQGWYDLKETAEWVIWSVVPESITQMLEWSLFEALKAWEIRILPFWAREHDPNGFSMMLSRVLRCSISSLLNPPTSRVLDSRAVFYEFAKCACLIDWFQLYPPLRPILGGFPWSFQQVSFVWPVFLQ